MDRRELFKQGGKGLSRSLPAILGAVLGMGGLLKGLAGPARPGFKAVVLHGREAQPQDHQISQEEEKVWE